MSRSHEFAVHRQAPFVRARVSPTANMRCGAFLVVGLTLGGCGPDKAEQQQAQHIAAFAQAAKADPDLADPLGQAIVELSRSHAPGWVKEGTLLRGSLQERGRQAFLLVLKYGHCYRLIGVTGNEAGDLDLLLYDSNGVETQRDVTQSPNAVLGAAASICPSEPIAVRVEARMRTGSGPFAIALLHDPA
jgi:hypothetical protein